MHKHTITRPRPGPQQVGPAQAAPKAAAAPRPIGRIQTAWLSVRSRHNVLGTAYLMAKVHQWGRNTILGWFFALFFGLPALVILLLACWPYLAYGVSAPSSYQPTVLEQTLLVGAPGETARTGLHHPTTLIFTFSDHLRVVEVPAGDAKRTSVVDATNFQQHGANPRILSAQFVAHAGHAHPDLLVRVSMDWQSLTPDVFDFVFANHPEYLSATPGSSGYQAAQFGLVSVTKEPKAWWEELL